MQFRKIFVAAGLMLGAAMATAESAPKAVDLNKMYKSFENAGYSSLELMDTTKQVLISGVALDITESFDGNSVLKVGTAANSKELARLTAGDEAQEKKLTALKPGAKFKAVCDMGFSSGTEYMSFQGCVFK